jgi:hypothetical protein
MSELDETGRALLALASDAHDPTDQDRARVRTALAARLGAAAGLGVGTAVGVGLTAKAAASVGGAASTGGAATGVVTTGGAGAAVAAATGGALGTKLVGVALVLTTTLGVGTAVKLARRTEHAPPAAKSSEAHGRRALAVARRDAPPPASEAPAAEAPAVLVPAAVAAPSDQPLPAPTVGAPAPAVDLAPNHEAPATSPPSPDPSGAGPQAPARIDAPEAAGPAQRRRATTATGASDRTCPSTLSNAGSGAHRSPSAVADEARLVHDGVLALRSGQPACALSLLDTHARFYPDGVLAEERAAERALALADLGRVAEARAAAAEFLHAHPTSPLGVRLRHRIPGLDVTDESR